MNDNEKEKFTEKLGEAITEGCILLIGPDAFFNDVSGKTLREEFVIAVQNELANFHVNLDPVKDNILSATIAMHKGKEDSAEAWIKDYWDKINPLDYPLLGYYSQLKFKAYFYFGYDSLLYSRLSTFSNNSQHIICTYKPGQGALRIRNEDGPVEIIDIMKDDKVPVVNWFGKLSDYDENVNSLVGRIYSLVENLSGKNSDSSNIKNLINQSEINHIIMTGADMSFWYNKMLSLLCTRSFKRPKGFFERNEFENQIDSNIFSIH